MFVSFKLFQMVLPRWIVIELTPYRNPSYGEDDIC